MIFSTVYEHVDRSRHRHRSNRRRKINFRNERRNCLRGGWAAAVGSLFPRPGDIVYGRVDFRADALKPAVVYCNNTETLVHQTLKFTSTVFQRSFKVEHESTIKYQQIMQYTRKSSVRSGDAPRLAATLLRRAPLTAPAVALRGPAVHRSEQRVLWSVTGSSWCVLERSRSFAVKC